MLYLSFLIPIAEREKKLIWTDFIKNFNILFKK